MIESLYPVKQRHTDQVLTHTAQLCLKLQHRIWAIPALTGFCAAAGRAPHPPTQGSTEAVAVKRKEKKSFSGTILHLCRAVTNVSLAELPCSKLGIWLVTARIFKPLLSYLQQSWTHFVITSYLTFFPQWWLQRCKAFWPAISKVPALKNSTTQVPAHQDYSITHTYIRFLSQEHTELKPRAALITKPRRKDMT